MTRSAPDPAARGPGRGRLAATLVFVLTLLLCLGGGGGAWWLLTRIDTAGAPRPEAAVHAYLTAVYTERDAAAAASLFCAQERDRQAIADRVGDVQAELDRLRDARYRWGELNVRDRSTERATVTVTLVLTADDQPDRDRELAFTVVNSGGWRVCGVTES